MGSPRTERLDRGEKLAIYRRDGVTGVWLVNLLEVEEQPNLEARVAVSRLEALFLRFFAHPGEIGHVRRIDPVIRVENKPTLVVGLEPMLLLVLPEALEDLRWG